MALKKVVILGSTGSIGVNTLKVVDRYPGRFKVVGLTAYNNVKLIEKQIAKYKPQYVAVPERAISQIKKSSVGQRTKVLHVYSDLEKLVTLPQVDVVVIGMRGSAALAPFLAAVRKGKTVAPANKEALVVAGEIIMKEARKYKATIIPVDSEQSAIFQCLERGGRDHLRRILLTASGGTLCNVPRARFNRLSVQSILKHPRWKMGKKITVDSASLMNKGFEVIEAARLFGLSVDQIEVVIHPEAIIHSMVEFADGSIISQLGITDMRLPIQYALTYPARLDTGLPPVDFFKLKKLTFKKPDYKKFPSLELAFYVGQKGGTLPCVLNAADEIAVEAYLKEKIKFTQIHQIVEKVVHKHRRVANPGLKDIYAADKWARQESSRIIGS